MNEYFPKPKSLGGRLKTELDLSNYATKADLRNAKGFDTSDGAKKTDLANLKSDADKIDIHELIVAQSNLSNLKRKVDKSDIGKLETTPMDLSKLSNILKNGVIKNTESEEFVKNVSAIHRLVILVIQLKKTDYNTKTNEIAKTITNYNHDKYVTTQEFNKLA